jgi:hypothetical protein
LLRPLFAATLSTNSAFVVMTAPPFPQDPGDLVEVANVTASSDALEPNPVPSPHFAGIRTPRSGVRMAL